MKYFQKLLGERVYLSPRGANDEDAEIFTEWLNDFQTTDFIARSGMLITVEGEIKYLKEAEGYHFSIIELETNKLLGSISLENVHQINRYATLGIFIGDKDSRNKGYGAEAIELILDFGFNYLNLNNIKLDVLSFNERAIACYKKCGFKYAGCRRQCEYINGKYYDRISMDILKEEFTKTVIKNKNI